MNNFLIFCLLFTIASGTRVSADESRRKLIQAFKEAGKPGNGHQVLSRLEGKWKVRGLVRIDSKSNPEMISGTANLVWIHGRRFLLQEFDCKQIDFSFSGTGILGYDTLLHEFTGAWCDNSNTGIANWKGSFSSKSNQLVFEIEQTDLLGKEKKKARATYTFNEDLTVDYRVTVTDSSGVEFSQIEIQYRKKKGI